MEKKFSIFGMLTFLVWFVLGMGSAFAAWNGTSTTPATLKDGYYIIDSEAKLAWYAKNYKSGNAKLTADLDLGGKLWTPIAAGKGGNGNEYAMIFDGDGHIIKNLYVNADELAVINKDYAQNLGFVGVLGGGTIKNLTLENVDVQASTNAGDVITGSGAKDHQISVGAFVGWMSDVGNSVVEKCMATGTIRTTGSGQGVGGIVGNAKKGTITNCLSLVEILASGSKADIGGIIGITKSYVTISSCVYAGPGLTNTGTNGSKGGIAGNVVSGTLTTEEDYYEGQSLNGVGKYCANCIMNGIDVNPNNNIQQVGLSNVENVACELNGKNTDGSCKMEPWAVGETSLSLNGYGTDGYKIVFYANGGKYADGSEAKNKFFDAGMAINADDIVVPSDEENTFMGWALTRDAAEPAENLGTVSRSDTVFAVWQEKLTVTFNVNPGVFPVENVDVKTKKVDKGGLVTVGGLGALPTSYCAEKLGDECIDLRYFTGWAMTENHLESDTIHLDDFIANEDLTLYAVWTADTTYTVTYNANGHGKTRVDYVRVKNGNTIEKPQGPIAHDGYVFVDWFTGASCEDSLKFNFNSPITESIILYAKWLPETYTITYDIGNGLANAVENPSEYNIETETIYLKAPTPAVGEVFDGWYNDAAFSKKITKIAKGSFGNKTFYAKWSTKTYRIMYLADNNSYGAVSDQLKEHGTPLTLADSGHFNRLGYYQTGWALSADGEKAYAFEAIYDENAAQIFYPSWALATYTITYVCEVCSENNPATPRTYMMKDTKNGNLSIYNPVFSSDEYEFKGWYWDEDYTNRTTNIPKSTLGDVVLYGKMLKYYYITYELNGSTKSNNRPKYTVETATFQLADPDPREGYTFGGWFDNAKFKGDAVTEIPLGSKSDMTLYAKWNKVYPFVTQYGAITVTEYENGTSVAEFDGESMDEVNIPNDVHVNQVIFNRVFSVGKPSTVVLPFSIDTSKVHGGQFYNVALSKNAAGLWVASGDSVRTQQLTANTPYVVIVTAADGMLTFDGPVTLNTSGINNTVTDNEDGSYWTFTGTYAYHKWVASETKKGTIYGFAARNASGAKVGEFVRVGEGAWIRPMRAYLVYHPVPESDPAPMLVKAMNSMSPSFASVDVSVLPEQIDFLIGGGDNSTTAIARRNIRSSETRFMDQWCDLKGRKLKNKPTAKGIYYYNGKRVIVK